MAQKIPFLTLFSAWNPGEELAALVGDYLVTGAVVDKHTRSIRAQVECAGVPEDGLRRTIERSLALAYRVERVELELSAPASAAVQTPEPEPAPAPYKAPPGARPAASSGGFKPLAPERRAPAARPAPQPVVPPTAPVSSSEDEFKPLNVGRQSTPPAASGGLRFSEDFSRPKSGAPAPRPQAPPRPSAPPRPPQRQAPPAAPAPAASADFTPGIVNRPAKAPSRRTFQWEQLEEN